MAIKRIEWPASSDWKQILTRTWQEAGDDNIGLLAAGVAFYAFLAFVPLLAAVILTYGMVADPVTVAAHIQSLAQSLPQDAASIIGDQLRSLVESEDSQKGLSLLIAIAVALYGASKGAGAVITALNVAYEVEEARGFIGRTLVAFALTAGAVLTLMLGAAAISALAFVGQLLPTGSPLVHGLLQIGFWLLAALAVSFVVAMVYRWGPNRPDAPWMWVTPGSAAATLLWLAATFGFGLYVRNFGSYNATYGSLGGVVIFLTWLYLSAYIMLMGAELNSEIERQQAGEPAPGGPKKESAAARDGQEVAPVGDLGPRAAPAVAASPTATAPRRDRDRSGGKLALGGLAAIAVAAVARLRRRERETPDRYRSGGAPDGVRFSSRR